MHQSLSLPLSLLQVRGQPHGFFSIQLDSINGRTRCRQHYWYNRVKSHRFSASCTLSCNFSMLQQSLSLSLFKRVLQKRYKVRTDGEVAVFVREIASLVTGKTDKIWTLATRLRLIGPRVANNTEPKYGTLWGSPLPPFPSPSLTFPFPSPPLPFPLPSLPFRSLPLPPLPLEVGPVKSN